MISNAHLQPQHYGCLKQVSISGAGLAAITTLSIPISQGLHVKKMSNHASAYDDVRV